jgi:peptidoglycan/LPS O-acetylase OafA/YrhL
LTAASHDALYRRDIDGLRAIAVLAVIGFHAFPRAVPGGFVGVDVFFVISGYLISGILFREAERGIDLAEFYVRRVRRIFPALVVVLTAVTVSGRLVLTNADYSALQKHIAAGATFVSNFVLWREAGYFDAPSRLKPLLHLWSLGIEEQFYLFWPPIMYFCAKRKVHAGKVAAAIALVSFILNCAFVRSAQSAAFYSPVTRMWELLLGALLAYPRGRNPDQIFPRSVAGPSAWIGVMLIGAALYALTNRVLYPGWWALLPTIGTALVIGAGPASWPNRYVLARGPLVAIGLISYPLYLWHWPLLVLIQITEGGAPSAPLKSAAVGVSLILATLTYLLVERPIRRGVSVRTPWKVAAIVASLLLVGGASLAGWQLGWFKPAAPYLVAGVYIQMPSPRQDLACRARFPTSGEYCQQYASANPVTTALLGNSHAEHFLEGVGAYLATKGENVVHLGESGCAPLIDLQRFVNGTNDTCRVVDNSVISLVVNDSAIHRVILSFNGVAMATGTVYRPGEGAYQTMELAGTMLPPEDSLRIALERTVRMFSARGKAVWLLLQVPEMDFGLAECIPRPFSFEHKNRTPCAVLRSRVVARQSTYRQIVREATEHVPELHVFDPLPYLCDDQWCYAIRNGDLLYADDNHLNREGSTLFAGKFAF